MAKTKTEKLVEEIMKYKANYEDAVTQTEQTIKFYKRLISTTKTESKLEALTNQLAYEEHKLKQSIEDLEEFSCNFAEYFI